MCCDVEYIAILVDIGVKYYKNANKYIFIEIVLRGKNEFEYQGRRISHSNTSVSAGRGIKRDNQRRTHLKAGVSISISSEDKS